MIILPHTDRLQIPRGRVHVQVLDAATGRTVRAWRQPNLVTLVGRNGLRDALETNLTHIAVGTGTTAAAAGDTALAAEVYRDVITQETTSDGSYTARLYIASGSANGSSLNEAGLFDAASAGNMYARFVFQSAIAKTSSIAVQIDWTINLTAS